MTQSKYERVVQLYHAGRLSKAGVARAVVLGWLTQAQADELLLPHEEAE